MAKVSSHPFSGMIGYMQTPHPKSYMTSILAVSDRNLETVNFFINEPGAYDTIYYFATQTAFQRVNLFSTVVDIRNLSDIYRLCNDIFDFGKPVYFYYPEKLSEFGDTFNSNFYKGSMTYVDPSATVGIEYIINGKANRDAVVAGTLEMDGLLYDIQITTNDKTIYIPAQLAIDEFPKVKSRNFEMILPYSKTRNGGISMRDMLYHKDQQYAQYIPYCYTCAFTGPEEYTACINSITNLQVEPMYNPGTNLN